MNNLSENEKSIKDILNSGAFLDNDMCILHLESNCDVLYRVHEDYFSKSISSSGLSKIFWETFSNEEFANHPVRKYFEEKIGEFTKKEFENYLKINFSIVPGLKHYEIRHDEKFSTVFFNLEFFATVGQLKKLPSSILDEYFIVVQTPIGKFQII